MRRPPVVGVLLAAGRGSRFDPDGTVNKLLAALPDGTPVAVQAARHLRAVLDDVVAVVPAAGTHGAEVERLAALLAEAGCEVLRCTRAARGMGPAWPPASRRAPTPAAGSSPWPTCHGWLPTPSPGLPRRWTRTIASRRSTRAGAGIRSASVRTISPASPRSTAMRARAR